MSSNTSSEFLASVFKQIDEKDRRIEELEKQLETFGALNMQVEASRLERLQGLEDTIIALKRTVEAQKATIAAHETTIDSLNTTIAVHARTVAVLQETVLLRAS